MAEHINRDEVVNWLKKVGKLLKAEHDHKEKTALVGKIIDHIESIPTADVVEVVRCRECKNQHTFDCPMNYEAESFNEDDGYDPYMATNACNDDGFCWLGERKDGDTDE